MSDCCHLLANTGTAAERRREEPCYDKAMNRCRCRDEGLDHMFSGENGVIKM